VEMASLEADTIERELMVCESRGEGRTSSGGNEDWMDVVGSLG